MSSRVEEQILGFTNEPVKYLRSGYTFVLATAKILIQIDDILLMVPGPGLNGEGTVAGVFLCREFAKSLHFLLFLFEGKLLKTLKTYYISTKSIFDAIVLVYCRPPFSLRLIGGVQ